MTALHFACTTCGRCCHGLRLPLSVDEAIAWTTRGGLVQILCHAAPDVPDESEAGDYKRRRSFAARSGALPIRVQVMLVARFEGACPNLRPDMRCGIYEERPNVCRIYPAEVIPGRGFTAEDRLCPPEAWSDAQPPFLLDDGRIVDDVTRQAIADARLAGLRDTGARRRLVASLGIDLAALENEGFAVWTLDPEGLVDALRAATDEGASAAAESAPADWRFLSLRAETADLIASTGARVVTAAPHAGVAYLPLY